MLSLCYCDSGIAANIPSILSPLPSSPPVNSLKKLQESGNCWSPAVTAGLYVRGGWGFYSCIRDSKTWVCIWFWACVLNEQLLRVWPLPTLMESHPLRKTAGVSVSFSDISRQVTAVSQIHFSWSIFGKIQSLFYEENFSHGMKMSLSMRKDGLLSLGDTECIPSMVGRKGSVFLFPPGISYCLCFLLNNSSLPCFPPVFFWHSVLPILHLTLVLPVFNSTNVCLVPSSPPCFFCSVLSLFQWRGQEEGWDSLILLAPCFSPMVLYCFFSHLRWEIELRQAEHGLHPPGQPARAPLWLIIPEAQGAWFYLLWLRMCRVWRRGRQYARGSYRWRKSESESHHARNRCSLPWEMPVCRKAATADRRGWA